MLFKKKNKLIKRKNNDVYSADLIADFVVKEFQNMKKAISNAKIQRLLFIIQERFIHSTHEKSPCFKEEMVMWEFGPVVPIVYYNYQKYGLKPINDECKKRSSSFSIHKNDQFIIKAIVEEFSEYSLEDLNNHVNNILRNKNIAKNQHISFN